MRIIVTALLLGTFISAGASAQAPDSSERRSPIAAGVSSFILPGLGSSYAGNWYHAAVHGSLALGLGVAGAVAIAGDDCEGDGCVGQNQAAIAVLAAAYLTNQIWSVFTAAKDARAYNRWIERPRAERIDLTPALHVAAGDGEGSHRRMELRLVRVEY